MRVLLPVPVRLSYRARTLRNEEEKKLSNKVGLKKIQNYVKRNSPNWTCCCESPSIAQTSVRLAIRVVGAQLAVDVHTLGSDGRRAVQPLNEDRPLPDAAYV